MKVSNPTNEDQRTEMRTYYTLYDRMLNYRALARAFAKVRRAQGAPGVDGQTIAAFSADLRSELNSLLTELRTKTYQAHPVLRVSPRSEGPSRPASVAGHPATDF